MGKPIEKTSIGRIKIGEGEYSSTLLFYMDDREITGIYYKEFKQEKPMVAQEFVKQVRALVGNSKNIDIN